MITPDCIIYRSLTSAIRVLPMFWRGEEVHFLKGGKFCHLIRTRRNTSRRQWDKEVGEKDARSALSAHTRARHAAACFH